MPGQSAPSFSLTTAFVPNGKDVLAGFLSVDSDAGTTAGSVRKGYGLSLIHISEPTRPY